MSGSGLHEVVAERLELNWDRFREAHPHLANAVERVDLIEVSVGSLRDDESFQRAMTQAQIDEKILASASGVMRLVDEAVERVLGL